MNIFEYTFFQNDVNFYFKTAIEKYNLKLTTSFNSTEKPINNFVYLENEHCVICLDNISSFPYPDITDTFFIKSAETLLEIDQSILKPYINLKTEEITNFISLHNENYANEEVFQAIEFGSYKYGIKLISDIVVQFYSSLLNGEINNHDLLKIIKK